MLLVLVIPLNRSVAMALELRILLVLAACALLLLLLCLCAGKRAGLLREVGACVLMILLSLVAAELLTRLAVRYSASLQALNVFHGQGSPAAGEIQNLEQLLASAPFRMQPRGLHCGFIMNSKGLRTPEYTMEKDPDQFRIVVIGDSFVISSAVPYPDHFTVLLQQRMQTLLPGKRVEMINLGVSGVGAVFEKKMLEIEACRLRPDLLIWCFFVGNDFTDEMENPPVMLHEWPFVVSTLLRVIRGGVIVMGETGRYRQEALPTGLPGTYVGWEHYDPSAPTMSIPAYLHNQFIRARVLFKSRFPWRNWSRISAILLSAYQLCRERQLPLLFVVIPDETQVNAALRRAVLAKIHRRQASAGQPREDMCVDLPQQLLNAFFRRQGIPAIDLLPAFRRAGRTRRLYKLRDSHWNEAGNHLAAESIFEHIRENACSDIPALPCGRP